MTVRRSIADLGFYPNKPPDIFLVTMLRKPIGFVKTRQLFFLVAPKPLICMVFYILQAAR